MHDLDLITFEPWADPVVDHHECHPEGTYSRLAWLPIIGPSSWLMWGTLASQLRREPEVSWDITALAEAHGLQRGTGRNGMVCRTLTRLTQFRILSPLNEFRHLVRLSAPPVSRRQLERLPIFVAELHHQTFGQDLHPRVG